MAGIDTSNKFQVSADADRIRVGSMPVHVSHDDAALLAAYLVKLGVGREAFIAVLDAVEAVDRPKQVPAPVEPMSDDNITKLLDT